MNVKFSCIIAAVCAACFARAATPGAAKMFGSEIADTVEKVMPSVVVVRTEAVKYYIGQDGLFGRLYRIPEKLAGQGSGVVISKDGFILTNNHVVDEAENIEVVFNDGTKVSAKVVGADPHTDLAVLKVGGPRRADLRAIQIGDSDALRVGEFVIAVGSPFSLKSSVTLGIVSQKGRALDMLPYEDFIQTDAAVNMGNSGGPLLDVDGHMVGINSVIQTSGDSDGNIGISFAIPANLAMTVAQSLMKSGKWVRPWIGVSMAEEGGRVLVDGIVSGSPAARAGLAEGDVIVSVDGSEAHTAHDVQRVILERPSGEKVTLKILRADKERTVTLSTAEMPEPKHRGRR